MSFFQAIILAIIEGLTEFLPVSSTGHMIIGSSIMGIAELPFTKLFTVAIQLGAVLSVAHSPNPCPSRKALPPTEWTPWRYR